MVDVSAKPDTKRTQSACLRAYQAKFLNKLPDNPKGNPLEVARLQVQRGQRL